MSHGTTVDTLEKELGELRNFLVVREHACEKELSRVHENHRERARNLVHYQAFRERAPEGLQAQLERLGLDPLLDIEWDVLGRIDRVLRRLSQISGTEGGSGSSPEESQRPGGRDLLRRRTADLFGLPPDGRNTRIMVTLPVEAAEDPGNVSVLTAAGADCYRINCARDSREGWHRLIDVLRDERLHGKGPLIFMDLGGSKLRVTSCTGGHKSVRVQVGDSLYISKRSFPSLPSGADAKEEARRVIAVSEPSALSGVLPGHQVWFDDGKIGGVVRERGEDALHVEITHAKKGGGKLRLERGLNLPDTPLRLPALTQKDLQDLPFAARHADFLALSFIRTPEDVHEFRAALQSVNETHRTIVIKIETREALRHLPEIMLAGMCHARVAVLLARGDLGVECGLLQMPRIQRDIVRYCAAAGLPLFWATGVMERMCRTGEPLRAEITDAVEAARAQCVMLNRGPRTIDALRMLGELLTRISEDK